MFFIEAAKLISLYIYCIILSFFFFKKSKWDILTMAMKLSSTSCTKKPPKRQTVLQSIYKIIMSVKTQTK